MEHCFKKMTRKGGAKRMTVVLVLTESIEMELFTSEESCSGLQTQETQEDITIDLNHLEHPLVPDTERTPEPQRRPQPWQEARLNIVLFPRAEDVEDNPPRRGLTENIEIEMEVFPPISVPETELLEIESDHPSIMTTASPPVDSESRSSHVRWKRTFPQSRGLLVKDIVCIPRAHYLLQQDRHSVPRGKERAALVAMGMTSRITIDYGWSANQMENRLAMLFRGRFLSQPRQKFSFSYLQCLQSSRVLLVPEAPADGWTGEQVIRISGHGPLYILIHHEYHQGDSTGSKMPVNRQEFFLNASTDSCPEEEVQEESWAAGGRTAEKFIQDVDTVLRVFRQENLDRGGQTLQVHVRRRDVLRSALKVLRRPVFSFRVPPVISFCGEETNGHEGPLREFFRLAVSELQQSCVFEGHQGRLLLTYDLTALEDRKYYEAGVLIGWSLAQGGPGPRCLHPALYQLMCGRSPSLKDFDWRDIADTDVQTRLQQLHSSTSVRRLSASLCDWLSSCGLPAIYSTPPTDLLSLYTRLVKHYVYHRVASMISQFTEGLNSCGGLWDTVRLNWEEFEPLMTDSWRPLTLLEFTQLFTCCFSSPESELRTAEERTARHWERALSRVADGQTDFSFEDLLVFITGADHLPPLGFTRKLSLHFYCQDVGMLSGRLPHASTCALELYLPRGVASVDDLTDMLSRVVHETFGFSHIQTDRLDVPY